MNGSIKFDGSGVMRFPTKEEKAIHMVFGPKDPEVRRVTVIFNTILDTM